MVHSMLWTLCSFINGGNRPKKRPNRFGGGGRVKCEHHVLRDLWSGWLKMEAKLVTARELSEKYLLVCYTLLESDVNGSSTEYWILKSQDQNHVALNFSRVYILIPAAKSNLSLRSKRVAYSLPWLSLVRMSSHELIDAQFDRAVEIVQSLPKTGPIQTDYDEKLTMYRWGSLLRLFFWRPFLFYLQSI